MRKAFDFEGPLFVFLSRLADLIWLNILFIICSLPVFTIGASLTAMYYVTLKMAKDEEGYITKSFFKSFKQNFLQATGIWMILLLAGVIIVTDYRIVSEPALSTVITSGMLKNVITIGTIFVSIVELFVITYVFPILAKFENSVKNTIKNAFFMSIRHLPYTIVLVLIPAVPFVLMYFYTAMILLVFIMFSLISLISAKIFVKIFDNYIPKEVTQTINSSEDENEEKEQA